MAFSSKAYFLKTVYKTININSAFFNREIYIYIFSFCLTKDKYFKSFTLGDLSSSRKNFPEDFKRSLRQSEGAKIIY